MLVTLYSRRHRLQISFIRRRNQVTEVTAGSRESAGRKGGSWRSWRGRRVRFDCAPWVHKAHSMPREEFTWAVEKELTGKEEEPSELIYFKVYKNQIPVIEQALEIPALMLGSDKSRGYLTSSGRSSQLWSMTRSDGSNLGSSCHTVVSRCPPMPPKLNRKRALFVL